MSLFFYRAADRSSGQIEAESLADAKARLREEGVLITQIGERRRARRAILSGDALVNFTLQLAQLVRSGLLLYESLTTLADQYRGERFHPILTRVCDGISTGRPLSDALADHPESFGRLYCAMIKAGENAGNIEIILERLATLLSRRQKLRKSLTTALLYPVTIAIFCSAVVVLLLAFAIPAIEQLFEGRQVNGFTRLVLATSHFFSRGWPLLLGIVALKGIVGFFLLRRLPLRLWALRFPLIGSILVQASLARFCRTLGTLLESGVTTLEALRLARPVMLCDELEAVMVRVEEQVIGGGRLSHQLGKERWIPPLMARMVAVGEEGGNLAPMMQRIASLYEEELEKRLTRLVALAQPVILLVMGVLVGVIMLAVLLPLTDVSGLL